MLDLRNLQAQVFENKKNKNFNTTDVNKEFCLAYGEMSEAYNAWLMKKEDLGEEIADVAIYLLGISEMLNIDLEAEIIRKVEINKGRRYRIVEETAIRVEG